MGAHGYLAISPDDTSVMLIDCARMESVWNLAQARGADKDALTAAGGGDAGAVGRARPRMERP